MAHFAINLRGPGAAPLQITVRDMSLAYGSVMALFVMGHRYYYCMETAAIDGFTTRNFQVLCSISSIRDAVTIGCGVVVLINHIHQRYLR